MKTITLILLLGLASVGCDDGVDGPALECDQAYVDRCWADLEDCYLCCQAQAGNGDWGECALSNCNPSMCDCLYDLDCEQPVDFHFDCFW